MGRDPCLSQWEALLIFPSRERLALGSVAMNVLWPKCWDLCTLPSCQSPHRSHTYFDTEQQGHERNHDEEEQEEHEEPRTPVQPATEPHHAHVLL